ncbi:MAG: hypothetical protein FJX63_03245 [Alphaproteobacteria bacterium]|nr:hypothetical protein [Alphaproteobacteria bacterium]
MTFDSELSLLKKAAGCAVIALGLFASATGLSVTAHADSEGDGDGGIFWDGMELGGDSEDLFGDNEGDGGLGGDGEGDGGIASLGDNDDECGETTEESQC